MAAVLAGQMLAGTSYQVLREIGAGGMGVVYEVEHVRLRKRYVAKIIHDRIRGDEDAQKRMEREAQVLAEINHPNVVQVHDVGVTADGTSYFVMEKLVGQDLRQAMKERSVTRPRAVEIVIDLLDALAHVHQRGLVHRDIKPENIFLAQLPNGITTKILDFGIVHIFDGERSSQGRITKTGGFVGTLYYAAPEQLQGRPAGPPNDVYAVGLVLYELLAGRGPFDDDPGVGLSRCFKPAPSLDASQFITPELAACVAASLEQEPERRPTAGDLAQRLRAVLAQALTNPGVANEEAVRADVDDLLRNLPIAPTHFAGTQAPATPLMSNAPSRVTMSAAPAVTLGSPVFQTPAPPLGSVPSTSPGVYTTIDVSQSGYRKPASRGILVATAVAFVAILAIGAGVTMTIVKRAPTTSAPAVVAAAPPPAVTSVFTPEPIAADTVVAPASGEPATASADAVASASSSATGITPRASAPRLVPGAAPKKGNAEKDGYSREL